MDIFKTLTYGPRKRGILHHKVQVRFACDTHVKHVAASDTQVICHVVEQMSSAFERSTFIAPKGSEGD